MAEEKQRDPEILFLKGEARERETNI